MSAPRTLFALACLSLTATAAVAAEPFRDDFKSAELTSRRAMRGPWQIADGVAKCTQDDELYKTFKDHGPILFYDVPLTDGVIKFRYRAHGAKTVVFTLNGEGGHIFRFVISERGTDLRGFPPDGDVKSISLGRDEKQPLTFDQWVDVTVTMRGPQAEVQIGGAAPLKAEHASPARAKTNVSLGFSFGTLEVAEFSITP